MTRWLIATLILVAAFSVAGMIGAGPLNAQTQAQTEVNFKIYFRDGNKAPGKGDFMDLTVVGPDATACAASLQALADAMALVARGLGDHYTSAGEQGRVDANCIVPASTASSPIPVP